MVQESSPRLAWYDHPNANPFETLKDARRFMFLEEATKSAYTYRIIERCEREVTDLWGSERTSPNEKGQR